MKRPLHAYIEHFYIIINLLLIGAAGFGLMSVQLSVEKGGSWDFVYRMRGK